MEWVKLASGYYLSRKVMTLPDADAEVMFLRGMGYCGEAETSGFVPTQALLGLGRRKHKQSAAALVAAGLWEQVDGGWLIVNWHEWQDELERLVERKKRDAERKRRDRAMSRDVSADADVDSPPNVRTQSREEKRRTTPNPADAGGCPAHPEGPHTSCRGCRTNPRALRAEAGRAKWGPWCGTCDERTRLSENADGLAVKCQCRKEAAA